MASYMDTIQKVLQGDFHNASETEKNRAVRELIQICSVSAGAVTVQPIPLLDIALISPIQIALVQAIARVHGYSLDKKTILEVLSTFGASLVAQNVILSAAKFVPFFGWVVSISMAYALTYAIGEVSDHYFRHGRGVPAEELRGMFNRVYKAKKDEKQNEHKKNASLKDRLAQLKEAHQNGLLTKEEFERKKEDMMKDF